MKTIVWQPRALKQLKKLGDKAAQQRILTATTALERFPAVGGVKALVNHACGYRLRVGDYRILFNVLDAIEVVSIEEVKKRDESTY
ncbi:type II toxin-antitoxin system RelE family toxin [Methylococcus mesophilus]|uniref:type II toxin-antitoxin system RelE family toxin n=1 Tax=Methylococcus mesophilus TaxID=2993564 RepID=UPI00224A9A2A|nr:type II toxin-antitoxin system RelE/ParE family toxin [Methylococcus mesophilus]UZR28103.1 type II toxin-antitoxin system RelE/ParE family toxin [Methylococcus mesophilus]UZR30771.1 type II toxin-antitoxin system RelE/ParE family toxin [Methylococcus mesophilus]